MKKLMIIAIAAMLLLPIVGQAQEPPFIQLAWNPNTEEDLAGYRLYVGQASGQYEVTFPLPLADVQDPTNPSWTVEYPPFLDGGTFFFALTAYDQAGQESGYSNEVSHTFPTPDLPPAAPQGVVIIEAKP